MSLPVVVAVAAEVPARYRALVTRLQVQVLAPQRDQFAPATGNWAAAEGREEEFSHDVIGVIAKPPADVVMDRGRVPVVETGEHLESG